MATGNSGTTAARPSLWWISAASLPLCLSAGLAHSVFPESHVLPPLLGLIAGFLMGANVWGRVQ